MYEPSVVHGIAGMAHRPELPDTSPDTDPCLPQDRPLGAQMLVCVFVGRDALADSLKFVADSGWVSMWISERIPSGCLTVRKCAKTQ